ncbi:MAG: ADP-ribosylglycohydrolase family protein [Opitutales bacterium]
MRATSAEVWSGLIGLLIGDACGVPYEFRDAHSLPPLQQLEMQPPPGFIRTYAQVPSGTWSDDGAQALCLYASLKACGQFHACDFAERLLRWHDAGYLAVDGYVFDVGNQTSESIARLKRGGTTTDSGLCGERNNGNGSLMRCLPLALLHAGNDVALVIDAHRQSRVTHGHPRSQVCCALYCLWARRELQRHTAPWESATATLREIYRADPVCAAELEKHIRPGAPPAGKGSGYTVDCLHSARLACAEPCYERVIKRAISLGHDTDTTACVAGGIAGLRHGIAGIPERWRAGLRGTAILRQLGAPDLLAASTCYGQRT